MKIKIDWPATIAAIVIVAGLIIFPFANPCETEDAPVCTWNAAESGNGEGRSFTNFYGLTLYHI